MRVSPCGWLPTRDAVLSQAKASAECTHNHPEGIKGAVAIAEAIYLLRGGASKTDLKKHLEDTYHYDLTQSVDYIREHNSFDETCQVTVPQAIVCFLAGRTFEEVIRLAISIGGDSDTIGAISGSLAEAHFGIPPEIQQRALAYLPEDMRQIVDSFRQTIR